LNLLPWAAVGPVLLLLLLLRSSKHAAVMCGQDEVAQY
jgi:hypothetical protein